MTGFRIGTGFDAHRLVSGRPLVLGGISIAHPLGLEGHSDGDCLIHAVCDALLGALGEGDLGRHFPSDDPRWMGAASGAFLDEVARLVVERGYLVENIDATLIAEAPRLAPFTEAMRVELAERLGLQPEVVSVKAKSTDGLGAMGRGEGIAAQAVVLLRGRET